ncbi:hypothetical protein Trichorick_01573 (plasmid) [Candidatus Trichorickettsia mobilis]|uniref:hypothetical protein n=1 Tax=Candidatus Trichorickettsia mobilis TaxID=1346319 RepID=UPI002B263DD1|nr:hypothetical protein [Candidatus Trichorickettsia mobilis]WPY01655.1 hypothetical protein Trichorick_01573 [Candidatus Trichorickettsia mobilis]
MGQKMQNLSLVESNSQLFTVDNYLSFNLNDYTNLSLTTFQSLTETKSYIPITGCVLEHILTTTNLTNHEKLYYLLADSLALVSKNKNHHRSCALPSEDWSDRLGCSRSLVFTMQQSLVQKGYFIINKDWDKIGRNKRNLIIPTLPVSIFNHLNDKFSDRAGEHDTYNKFTDCKRSYLDRTKLFIKLNYDLLKIITSNEYLNPRQKILWLSFYTRCYKNYMLQNREVGKYSYNNDSSFSFISSYGELADLYSCDAKHLSKSIRTIEKLGFIKTQHFYTRNKHEYSCIDQERQDQSLWKITLSLPSDCFLKLEKVKNRSNLNPNDRSVTIADNTIDSRLMENYLMLNGIKFNLDLEKNSSLESIIDNTDIPLSPTDNYIDSVMKELETSEDLASSDSFSKTLPTLETIDNKAEKNDGIKSDPTFAKSGLLLNKDFLLKIKDIKSNLGATPKVLFAKFLKRFKEDDCNKNIDTQKKEEEFNIHSELIQEKLKELPRDKADKARKFAYSLVSKKLAKGYAERLTKHELAKQLIHHAASWKPTKLGFISRDKEIDTALSVAWKAIVGGTWKIPLELAKAEVLQYEFKHYRRKYQESGILSREIKSLEVEVNKLLGRWCDLNSKITEGREESKNDIANNQYQIELGQNYGMLDDIGNNLIDRHDYRRDFNLRHRLNRDDLDIIDNRTKDINLYDIDLSHISDEQRYLKLQGSNTDIMEIATIDHKQYFGKLKTIEVNDCGDLVMTLKPIKDKEFFGYSTRLPHINKTESVLDNVENLSISNVGYIDPVEHDQQSRQGFAKIDNALSGIFNALKYKKI